MKKIVLLFIVLAAALLNAGAAENPMEAELFPPDFLLAQREPLGLTEDQLSAIQSIVGEVKPRFEALKGKLEGRIADLREALSHPKPEVAQAEEKLRALLTDENEMKMFQLRLMLTLRDNLTPEQVAKARELRRQAQSKAPADLAEAARQRLTEKVERIKKGVQTWAASGRDPSSIAQAMEEKFKPLIDAGKVAEAEAELDRLLEQLKPDAK